MWWGMMPPEGFSGAMWGRGSGERPALPAWMSGGMGWWPRWGGMWWPNGSWGIMPQGSEAITPPTQQ